MSVFDHLEIGLATVPTVSGDKSRLQTPGQHFDEHLLKIIVFSLVRGFVINSVIDRLVVTMRIGVIQGDQIDPFHYTVMLSRPKIADEGRQLTVRYYPIHCRRH